MVDEQVRANRLSCMCEGCMDGGICTERDTVRPADVEFQVYEIHNQTGDHVAAHRALNKAGWDLLQGVEEGDLVGIHVPEINRVGTNSNDGDLWESGRFMVGEIAEVPLSWKTTGSRRRDSAKAKIFLPQEVEGKAEKVFRFQRRDVCRGLETGELVPVGKCACGKKHYTEVPIPLVRGGPWKAADWVGQEEEDDGEDSNEEQGAGQIGGGRPKRVSVAFTRGYQALLSISNRRRGGSGARPGDGAETSSAPGCTPIYDPDR